MKYLIRKKDHRAHFLAPSTPPGFLYQSLCGPVKVTPAGADLFEVTDSRSEQQPLCRNCVRIRRVWGRSEPSA